MAETHGPEVDTGAHLRESMTPLKHQGMDMDPPWVDLVLEERNRFAAAHQR